LNTVNNKSNEQKPKSELRPFNYTFGHLYSVNSFSQSLARQLINTSRFQVTLGSLSLREPISLTTTDFTEDDENELCSLEGFSSRIYDYRTLSEPNLAGSHQINSQDKLSEQNNQPNTPQKDNNSINSCASLETITLTSYEHCELSSTKSKDSESCFFDDAIILPSDLPSTLNLAGQMEHRDVDTFSRSSDSSIGLEFETRLFASPIKFEEQHIQDDKIQEDNINLSGTPLP